MRFVPSLFKNTLIFRVFSPHKIVKPLSNRHLNDYVTSYRLRRGSFQEICLFYDAFGVSAQTPQRREFFPSTPQRREFFPSTPQRREFFPSTPQRREFFPSTPHRREFFPSTPQRREFFPSTSPTSTKSSEAIEPNQTKKASPTDSSARLTHLIIIQTIFQDYFGMIMQLQQSQQKFFVVG